MRYTGAAGGASINLKFFGINDNNDDNSLKFNIGGLFLFQELMFRIRDSNFFLGERYQLLAADIDFDDFDGSSAEIAGGVGFRYLAARRLGMRVGLDIARGPEDTVVYLQVGSGWH